MNRGSATIFTFPFPMRTVLFEIDTDTVPSKYTNMADFRFEHAGGYGYPLLGIRINPFRVDTLWNCTDEPEGPYQGRIGTWRIKKTPTQVTAWFNNELRSEYTFKDKVISALSANILYESTMLF